MTDATTWWRIELNAKGSLVSVRRVESSEANSSTIVYVRAANEVEAKASARQAYNDVMRDVMRRRRERLFAEGKCGWCGEKNDRDREKRCSACVERDSGYSQRKRDKEAGRPVPKLNRSVALAARREQREAKVVESAVASAEASIRLQVFQEVQDAWLRNRTVGAFSAWLNGEIAKLSGKKVA